MKTKILKLKDIHPYANNPRINDHAVDAVAESISKFGYVQLMAVDKDDVLVVGHTRLKALNKLFGEDHEAEVIVLDHLSEEAINAYRIADNKVGELADWSIPELAYEVSLLVEDYDFSKLGFSNRELKMLLGEEEVVEQKLDEKIVISIGKDKFAVDPKEFEDWHTNFQKQNGKNLLSFLLDDLKLYALKRRYELSK